MAFDLGYSYCQWKVDFYFYTLYRIIESTSWMDGANGDAICGEIVRVSSSINFDATATDFTRERSPAILPDKIH